MSKRKLLHVVHGMARGGVETWLMHVLRNIDRSAYDVHILTATPDPRPYDDEVRELGCEIHFCAPLNRPLRYAAAFRRIVREHGPFDVCHSHLAFFSGHAMRLAHGVGIPVRIAHIHNTRSGWGNDKLSVRLFRVGYRGVMRRWIRAHATHGLACSEDAAAFLAGSGRGGPGFQVLLYGFDFSSFMEAGPRPELKRALGIPETRKVVGHVGRFVPQKNHAFLLEIFARAVGDGLDGHLLLLGDGHLRGEMEAKVDHLGLRERCTFAGEQGAIAPYMGAMDLFLFPSLHEGLGIVAVEAQAAGLPVVASDEVPTEADVVPGMVERLPLEAGAARWSERVRARLEQPAADPRQTTPQVAASPFGIDRCLTELLPLYRSA